MPDHEIVCEPGALRELAPEWDRLAVASGRPQMTPAWVLAWWEHLAPPSVSARVVAVHHRGKLIGVAPFFVDPAARRWRVDYRLPGIELAAGLEPLAIPGREWDVAAAVSLALKAGDPPADVIALEAMPLASRWPAALRQTWPTAVRPALRLYRVFGRPRVTLRSGSFEEWFSGKSANFRSQMRRARRTFAAAGGTTRISTEATLSRDVAAFTRLHGERWRERGHSNLVAFGARLAPMLVQAGTGLIGDGRFQMRLLEIEGEPISAQLFLAAGDSILYVNSGWDQRFSQLRPVQLAILGLIEDAFAQQTARVIDLGLGEEPYKLRFADGNDPVAWTVVVPPRQRVPLTAARLMPLLARYALRDVALRSLPEARLAQLRAWRSRLRRGAHAP
jgi:CelD/BcsL family acetyltransferase involved in cellulose biosynthesis